MPETPWISPFKIKPDPEKEYITVITYLPIKSYISLLEFFKQVRLVQEQLQRAHGVVAIKLRVDILTKKSYTMSVWEDTGSLKKFLSSGAHGELMKNNLGYLGEDRKFVTVSIPGKDFPPSWEWAYRVLNEY